jgi:hypothetical protein
MSNLQRAYHHFLGEPFWLIFLAFFQPRRFRHEVDVKGFWPRVVFMSRLAVSMFLIAYPFGLLGHMILELFHSVLHLNELHPNIASSLFLETTIGTITGITLGIIVGIAVGIVIDTADSIALGITSGITVSITLGTAVGFRGDIATEIVVAGGLAGVGVFISGGGFAGDNIIDAIAGLLGIFRLPFYLVSGPSALWAYFASRANPPKALSYLQRSSLHWDERVYLPLPYLRRTLMIAYEAKPEQTLAEIQFIAAERPQQLWAARAALIEIMLLDLEKRKNLTEIAGAAQRIAELLPLSTNLLDPRWETPIARLTDASRDVERYLSLENRRAKAEAMADMIQNLNKIYVNVAFRDQRLNSILGNIVEAWLVLAQNQQALLASSGPHTERIDNPYKAGIPLRIPGDTLFVGRRDIAQQLEAALSKNEGQPPFLMYGDRRMGKSSTLLQLPRLLSSRYISVFFNLQDITLYVSIFTLLEGLAKAIQSALSERGVFAPRFSFSPSQSRISPSQSKSPSQLRSPSPSPELHRASTPSASSSSDSTGPTFFSSNSNSNSNSSSNEASAYYIFSRWLTEVERMLEQEDKLLLLAFDEFEKLEEQAAKGIFDLAMLLDWLREIIQYHRRLVVLFSGIHTINEMGSQTNVRWSNYLINVRMLHIGLLRKEEATELITHPVESFRPEEVYGVGVIQKILGETAGHPFLVQAVCSALIDYLNTEQRAQATVHDVDQAIDSVLTEWAAYFSELWHESTEAERACLVTLQQGGKASIRTLVQRTRFSEQDIRRALERLKRRDLLIFLNNNNDICRITIPIFRTWIARRASHPLEPFPPTRLFPSTDASNTSDVQHSP